VAAGGVRRTVRRVEITEARREIWVEQTSDAEAGAEVCSLCGQRTVIRGEIPAAIKNSIEDEEKQ
jgi:hypothetical protein